MSFTHSCRRRVAHLLRLSLTFPALFNERVWHIKTPPSPSTCGDLFPEMRIGFMNNQTVIARRESRTLEPHLVNRPSNYIANVFQENRDKR